MEEAVEQNKDIKNKVYKWVVGLLILSLVFSVGFKVGGKQVDVQKVYDDGYMSCLKPVLDAAYSSEGDNLVTFRTDKWADATRKNIAIVECTLIEEKDTE